MEVVGKYGIRAKVLLRSRSAVTGIEFVTYEIEYPRLILAELNTHRMLSKNSASSRAIPYAKMLEQLTARPVRFGQANPGMQDKGEDFDALVNIPHHLYHSFAAYMSEGGHDEYICLGDLLVGDADNPSLNVTPDTAWEFHSFLSKTMAGGFYEAGYHKQVYNRLVEASQMMKTVISGTEWANFFWLRDHEAADPTIRELARVMKEASDVADFQVLMPGEWHLPYLDTFVDREGKRHYGDWEDGLSADYVLFTEYQLEDAIKVSCARCAAVSFRNVDYGLEKSREVYARLVGDERKHASAFEHCATPMKESTAWGQAGNVNLPQFPDTWEEGITHMDRQRKLWSGNLKSWIQYRKLIPGENFTGQH